MSEYANDVLVDTQWVEDHLSDDSIRIVEVDENPALYAEAHIPGAIGFDWKKDLQDQVKRDFLGPAEFGELFGSRGISNDHTIVLYGDRNNWFAAYTFWYLKYYGHDAVKLVNGPREKWISEGRPTTGDVPRYEAQTFETSSGDQSIRAYRNEVVDALDSGTSLVDVRSPQEFSGELIAMAGYEQEGAQRSVFLLSSIPQLILAIFIAAMLDQNIRAKTFWRMGVLLPYVMAPVAVALIFSNMFGDKYGLVNTILADLGIPPVMWHSDAFASHIAIATMVNFRWTGYNTLILLAAMQAIPRDYYEAAAIDGAGEVPPVHRASRCRACARPSSS